jgi:hypothetical protein
MFMVGIPCKRLQSSAVSEYSVHTTPEAAPGRDASGCCILSAMAHKIHSQDVTEGPAKAGARAMLRAVGLTDDDFSKPQVGLVSAGNEVTPCNVTGPELAEAAKEGVRPPTGWASPSPPSPSPTGSRWVTRGCAPRWCPAR